jgi:asparagine synthase (glutamine-hydrolysing)
MCGIAGIVAKGRVNSQALARMAGLQAHRGPDEENLWIDPTGRVGFAHRRLSIIDLSPGGRQPMRHPSGDTVIGYNGEIYNYLELGQRLRAEGVVLSTQSDTEVLLEAYRTWGDRALGELNGMFAFALYDANRRRLLCARDRYGEKPFLYVSTGDFFAYASEYKALLALAEVAADVDVARMLRFLSRGAEGLDDSPQTVFPAIRQLLPGEKLILDIDTLAVKVERYWTLSPDAEAARLDMRGASERFRDLLNDSVRLRLRSDVPLGSCLSGGLDSSSIVCLAREQIGPNTPYNAFSGRFPGTDADEGAFIDIVAEATRSTVHQVEPSAAGLLRELPNFMWHNELPMSSASQYAQWCVYRLARENGVVVLLDGQGGDELLGGYEQYFRPYCAEPRVSADERAAIRDRYPRALPTRSQLAKESLPAGMRRLLARWGGQGSDLLFGVSPDLAATIASHPVASLDHSKGLKGALFRETFRTVLPTLLRYGDRNSMAHSVEVRLPFCDHRLAEFVFALPPAYLMGEVQTKRLLREAMRGILPEAIRTRWNKQGFVPPQETWLKQGLIDTIEETISDPRFAGRGYWDVVWWRKTIARARAGEWGLAAVLWKAFIAEAWQRHFVERVAGETKVSVFDHSATHARDLRQSLSS